MAILERMAQVTNADQLSGLLPELIDFLCRQIRSLRERRVPLEQLLVTQKLSRELELYRSPSPAAQAAAQLALLGKTVRPGQPVRFLHVLGEPGVHAWDCPPAPDRKRLDIPRYIELLLRAAETVLKPIGITEDDLRRRLLSYAWYDTPNSTFPLWSARVGEHTISSSAPTGKL
jgi:DNA polymerase elongation subunit (family B)